MRVAVIRGDMPGPTFVADLEPKSQFNPDYEPEGQTRYVSRPTSTSVDAVMESYAPATILSTVDIVFPLVINAGNQTLKVRTEALAAFTTVLVPAAAYASISTLVTAINTVLPSTVTATNLGDKLSLQTVAKGAVSYLENDTVAGGSTFNTPASLPDGTSFTVPTAATLITATVPVGGPVDVSAATIRATMGDGLTDAQVEGLQDGLAPRFIDTDVAIKSFQVGVLEGLRSASFNPDPNRLPPLANGAAVSVVQDDGVTAFSAGFPVITNGQYGVPVAGAVTITGTALANPEVNAMVVKFILADGSYRTVSQEAITLAGGTVSATSIVIPASKVPSGVAVGRQVQVFYTSFASNIFTLV